MNKEEIEAIMREALKFYCDNIISKLPLKWEEGVIQRMLEEKQDGPAETIKELIKFTIKKTNKQHQKKVDELQLKIRKLDFKQTKESIWINAKEVKKLIDKTFKEAEE